MGRNNFQRDPAILTTSRARNPRFNIKHTSSADVYSMTARVPFSNRELEALDLLHYFGRTLEVMVAFAHEPSSVGCSRSERLSTFSQGVPINEVRRKTEVRVSIKVPNSKCVHTTGQGFTSSVDSYERQATSVPIGRA